jgi:hypothetical protein
MKMRFNLIELINQQSTYPYMSNICSAAPGFNRLKHLAAVDDKADADEGNSIVITLGLADLLGALVGMGTE